MSNEEAIKILKEVREEVLAKETELSKQVFENLGIKAMDLAIKALEQQQEPSEDCISRQVVKEMLTETWTKYMPMELDINLSFVLDKISALPSVTPSYNSVKIELISSEDCISRTEALKHSHIEYDDDGIGHRVVYVEDIEELPSVTPSYNSVKSELEPCADCISREKAVYVASGYCAPQNIADELRRLPSATPKAQWIPIKTRPMTEEEKEEIGHEYAFMYDCSLPDDGQDVLITDCYGNVEVDTFCRDHEGVYFETNCDDGEVIAWMPLPQPYKTESEDKE